MVSRQRGITLLGFIMVLLIAAVVAMIAMNLVPVYSEANSVKSALKKLAEEPASRNMELPELQRALQKRFDIDYVNSVKAEELELVRDKTKGTQLVFNYEVRKPLVYNLDFVAKFDNSIPVGGK
jgi:Tfp pilus assembly major pilin PilA